MTQIVSLLPIAYAAMAGLWTAHDPFVGKWKLDASRSTIVDQMAVEEAGPNKYTFRFEGGPAETVIANGTDQPGVLGTTLAVSGKDSRSLKVVRKQAGKIIVSANWKLSEDGKVLRDAFEGVQANGSGYTVNYVYKRMSGTSGFAGTWESTTRPVGLQFELQIQPYNGKGLSFVSQGSAKNITFDGQDHDVGGTAAGLVASGRRQNDQAMTYTEKKDGKVIDTRELALSSDRKTLTIRVNKTDQATPNVLVLERE